MTQKKEAILIKYSKLYTSTLNSCIEVLSFRNLNNSMSMSVKMFKLKSENLEHEKSRALDKQTI